MKQFLPVCALACFVLFCSCRKEKIIVSQVPVVHSWLLDSSLFGFNKILLNSLTLTDSTLAVANNTLIWYVNTNHLNKSIDGNYINFNPSYGYLISPNITRTIGATPVGADRLMIFSTTAPLGNYGTVVYKPTYTNSTISQKAFPIPAFADPGYPVIDSKYVLAPTEIDYANQKAYCSLIQIDYSANPFPNSVKLVSSRTLVLTPGPSTIGFADGDYFCATYFGKFFLAYNDQFYRIDTAGNVKAFGYSPVSQEQNGRVSRMFLLDNKLFAVGFSKIFVSQDQGENWTLFYDATGTVYTSLNYYTLNPEVFATYGSQIWKVVLSGSTLQYQELDTDGLQTNQITSINKTGKYAFVTTLSGLYYRDTASFNTRKK